MPLRPAISVVIPCRNEARTIARVLDDLEAQDLAEPFEVVAADGQSDDGTPAILAASRRRFPLRVVDNPDRAIPHALNRAVAAAAGEFIVRIDGHSRLDPGYLAALVQALRAGGDVVGPRIVQIPGAPGAVAGAIARLLGTRLATGGTPSRGDLQAPRPVEHTVMSSFRRQVWERIGGYDESLLSNEDFDFDYRAHRAGFSVVSLPTPVFHLMARASITGLARQRWRYGWWKAAVLWKEPASLRPRQIVPMALLVGLLAGLCWWPLLAAILALYAVAASASAVAAIRHDHPSAGAAIATLLLALPIYAVIHLVWSAGLLAGLVANRWRPASAVRRGPHRIAVVHDWIETCGGSELVLFEILRALPAADLFAVVDFRDRRCAEALAGRPVATSFIQRLPWARRFFRWYLPLMPLAIEQLDLSGYDLVVSSSHAVAKGIVTGPDQTHLCYCHSPLRYAWDQQGSYLDRGAFGGGPVRMFSRLLLHYLRLWDFASSSRVDQFLANSSFVAGRIRKYYRREAEVLHPPVDVDAFPHDLPRGSHYLTVSRLVAYKRIDLLVRAFAGLPDRELLIIGDGPERRRLEGMATPNVRFLGFLPTADVRHHLATARAFCFACEEDFGIVTVEAHACGTPVIAYGRGGTRDIVEPGRTGILFERQDPLAVREAIAACETTVFDPDAIRRHAARFSTAAFHVRLSALLAAAGHPQPSGARP